jgi:hypothetical protein
VSLAVFILEQEMNAAIKRKRSYPVFKATGREIIRRTTLEEAETFEKREIWRREYDVRSGALIGFRVDGVDVNKIDGDLRSMASRTTISAHDMELNVQRSRTFGLREEDRLARVKRGQMPEDEVERVKAKVRVYAVISPAKGDILRVFPR